MLALKSKILLNEFKFGCKIKQSQHMAKKNNIKITGQKLNEPDCYCSSSLIYLYLCDNFHVCHFKVPRSYRNKLCGVCGNSNKHGLDELYGPKQIMYSDPHAFVSTYMVPESTCDPTSIQKSYGVPEIRKKSS